MKKNLLYWLSICILHVHSYIYLAPHIPTKKVTRATTSVYYFAKYILKNPLKYFYKKQNLINLTLKVSSP